MSRSSAGKPPTTVLEVARPPTLSEAVLQKIREDLIRSRFHPGDPIRVDQLAAEYDVSAFPVREALRVLLTEGRVQYAAHRGYRVTALTLEEVDEIFLMCRLLEAEALRRGVEALDEAGVKRMRSLLAKLESPPRNAPLWEIVALHQDFHFVPIEYAQLPLIEAELRRLWDHTDHYRALYLFADPAVTEPMNEEHRRIADACEARDGEHAVTLMNVHRAHALEHLAAAREKEGDR